MVPNTKATIPSGATDADDWNWDYQPLPGGDRTPVVTSGLTISVEPITEAIRQREMLPFAAAWVAVIRRCGSYIGVRRHPDRAGDFDAVAEFARAQADAVAEFAFEPTTPDEFAGATPCVWCGTHCGGSTRAVHDRIDAGSEVGTWKRWAA